MGAPGKGEAWYEYQKAIDEEVEEARGICTDLNERLSESIGEDGTIAEIVTARGSLPSLNERLSMSMNNDGTLKGGASIVANWKSSGDTPTYVAANQFTVELDQTLVYVAGRRLQITLTSGQVYNVISSASYSGVTELTTVTLETSNIDATISAVDLGIVTAGSTGALPKHDHSDSGKGGTAVTNDHGHSGPGDGGSITFDADAIPDVLLFA